MEENIKKNIERIISDEMSALNRGDLFRKPIVAYSPAKDERYSQLKELIGEWHLNPTELLPDAESVVSYFVPFTKEVVLEPETVKDGSPLWSEAYEVINGYFNHINEAVSTYLTKSGYSAYALRATHTYDPKDMKSLWSHKSAAAIAGLGSFGANRILITSKGSGGRFCTVLTSACLYEENANQEPVENRCLYITKGTCGICLKACPANALTFDSIDRFACQEELFKNGEKLKQDTKQSGADTCGKCISVCPVAYIE